MYFLAQSSLNIEWWEERELERLQNPTLNQNYKKNWGTLKFCYSLIIGVIGLSLKCKIAQRT